MFPCGIWLLARMSKNQDSIKTISHFQSTVRMIRLSGLYFRHEKTCEYVSTAQNCGKGAGQHVEGQGLPSTFTNQTMCQPIGTEEFGEDILLLVNKKGLVCKYAGQALAFNIWPAHLCKIWDLLFN